MKMKQRDDKKMDPFITSGTQLPRLTGPLRTQNPACSLPDQNLPNRSFRKMFRVPSERPFPSAQDSLSKPSGGAVKHHQPLEDTEAPSVGRVLGHPQRRAPHHQSTRLGFCSACLPAPLRTGSGSLQPYRFCLGSGARHAFNERLSNG